MTLQRSISVGVFFFSLLYINSMAYGCEYTKEQAVEFYKSKGGDFYEEDGGLSLSLNNKKLNDSDLVALCALNNLIDLDIGLNTFTKIPKDLPISLKTLKFGFRQRIDKNDQTDLVDLAPLTRLINLEVLMIDLLFFKSIDPLLTLTKLSELHIAGNNLSTESFSNIQNAAFLGTLKYLYLDGNIIEDISFLKYFTSLQNVSLPRYKKCDLAVETDNIQFNCLEKKISNGEYSALDEILKKYVPIQIGSYLMQGILDSKLNTQDFVRHIVANNIVTLKDILKFIIKNQSVAFIEKTEFMMREMPGVINMVLDDETQNTALMQAALYYQDDVVSKLLSIGADKLQKNNRGQIAFDLVGIITLKEDLITKNKDCYANYQDFDNLYVCNFDLNERALKIKSILQ